MKCNLCNEEKVLIKKSHLIPDFFFKTLYDEHSRLIKTDFVQTFNGVNNDSTPPTSTYEKHILCAKCDNEIIGRYESYYAKFVFHTKDYVKRTFPEPTKINHYEYTGLDYNSSNIFFLTLLWRGNLSKRPEFIDVNLEPKLAENLRKQILIGNYDENSVRITALKLSEGSNFSRMVSQFKKIENYYTVILRDLLVFFHLENDTIYELSHNHRIDKFGKWILPEIPKWKEEEFIVSLINPKKWKT